MKDTDLPEDCCSIVVDSLSGEAIVGVKCVHPTKRELDPSARRWETTPIAEMGTADDDFKQNAVVGNVLALNFDFQVRQRLHQLLIEFTNPVAAPVVFPPGFIIVLRGIAEGAENSCQVMRVLQSDMFFDDRDPRSPPVARNRCSYHTHLPSG
jgi:hypothetical protein